MSQSAVVPHPEVLASIAQELEHAGELCDRLETLVTQLVRASRSGRLAIALHEAPDPRRAELSIWPHAGQLHPQAVGPGRERSPMISPTPWPASPSATSPTGWHG